MTLQKWSLRGDALDDIYTLKMPRNGVNGWIFDRPTNWTFRRAPEINGQSTAQDTDNEMAATTFPHFLSLPAELRIVIWEMSIEYIVSTVASQFPMIIGIENCCIKHMNWHYTKTIIRWRPIGHRKRPLSPQTGGNELLIPYFYSIMAVSKHTHLIACQFWKRHVKNMVDRPSTWRMVLYKAIYELIKDVHGNSAAGRTVYEVFFKLRTPI